jgi:translation initiation factor 2B subunit (eIF-2B alpha/beta/delta family)
VGPEYADLVEQVRSGNVVAFVGAGASRTYIDTGGRQFNGVPGAAQMTAELSSRRQTIPLGSSFIEACFLFKSLGGRAELERFLTEHVDRAGLMPLPAHTLLSALPFSAYITTNYDRLLEQALREAKRNPTAIIEDSDVPRFRLGATPVIKMHGCASRPKTMIAAADEYRHSPSPNPVMDALIRVTLANKTALFVGFNLSDHDFLSIQDWIDAHLSDRRPRGYALVADATDFQKAFWASRGITMICGDLTQFLRTLLRAASARIGTALHAADDWMNDVFFESLQKVRSLPTETEVIDAFLDHLLSEMRSPNLDFDVVLSRAEEASETVMRARPNYDAMRIQASALISDIRATCNDKDRAESKVTVAIEERRQIAIRIAQKGATIVARGDNLLLYSQSKRVVQLLKGVPAGVQERCHLYISECRPKSPSPFQDAVAFAEAFAGCGYTITLLPDMAALNFLARHQISKVLMGAHAVFKRGTDFVSFVNTCGSDAIVELAEREGVPVYVVAEAAKIMQLEASDPDPAISFQQEESIFDSISSDIAGLVANGQSISSLNIGYDLCRIRGQVEFVED